MGIIKPKLVPFVKWAGGKREVINKYLHKYFPQNFNNYIEPFAGAASVFLYLQPNQAIINDVNSELITTFKVIKQDVTSLVIELDKYHKRHSKEFFYQIRKRKLPQNADLKIAARFIYLNKTCFNGLYRVNKDNQFNVPFGNKSKENLSLYNADNLNQLALYLNTHQISFYNQDFETILEMAQPDDFVFCDPPYDFETKPPSFNAYNPTGFAQAEQKRLATALKRLDQKGVKWMHTNHETNLIKTLYKDFTIIPMRTNRNINANGSKRKNTGNEVVIMNY